MNDFSHLGELSLQWESKMFLEHICSVRWSVLQCNFLNKLSDVLSSISTIIIETQRQKSDYVLCFVYKGIQALMASDVFSFQKPSLKIIDTSLWCDNCSEKQQLNFHRDVSDSAVVYDINIITIQRCYHTGSLSSIKHCFVVVASFIGHYNSTTLQHLMY